MNMTRAALLIVLVATGCSSWRSAGRTAAIAGAASLACDWAQTRHAAANSWIIGGREKVENNPIMGPAPSTSTVDLYFASAAVIGAAVWLVLPEKVRPFWGGGITAVQSKAIIGNVGTTNTLCGVDPANR